MSNRRKPSRRKMVLPVKVAVDKVTHLAHTTLLVGIMVTSVQQGGFGKVWTSIVTLTFPYYVLSAGLAVTGISISRYAGWPALLVLLAVMFGVYSSYKLYFGGKKPHSEETQPKHLMS